MTTPVQMPTHCALCNKNLSVLKKSALVHANDKVYCSQFCSEKDHENLDTVRVSRILGSRTPFKAHSKRNHR